MPDEPLHATLTPRERQVMNVIYDRGEATAKQVQRLMADPPTNATVRSTLRTLEDKGHLTHYKKGREYVYKPTAPIEDVRRSMLSHVVDTLFGGSMPRAVAALLSLSPSDLSEKERRELTALIDQAEKEGR